MMWSTTDRLVWAAWTLIGCVMLWWNTRTALRFLPFAAAHQVARYGANAVFWLALLAYWNP